MKYTDRQIELNKYRKERKRKKARTIFTIFVCLFLSVGIVVTLFFAPAFNLVEVYVVGNERLSEGEIIAASELRARAGEFRGDNIFSTGTQRVISNIMTLPYVQEANVRRVFPNRIRIWVREKEPQAIIAYGEMFVVIDQTGLVLEVLQEQYNLPIIRGLNVDRAIPGEILTAENSTNMYVGLLTLNEIIANQMQTNIISIDVTNLTQITLNYENRIRVIMGDTNNLAYRIMFLQNIVETIPSHEHGTLDMSLENPPFTND
ncbi:MAG: FtsQ-type POTRA domain-containing protein [Oscillospiraceae bacterium]|nr:FtsQ-type POTRA domain-containing protein [Oscillospiraceae bacterium]